MIIDVHVHYQDRPGFLDELFAACDACGVDKVCLNGGGPQWGQVGNDEVEAALQEHPDRVIGFGFIKLGDDRPQIVDELHERGFKGLKTQNPRSFYDDREFFGFYERAEKYRMPILFHTGIGARSRNPRQSGTSSNYMRPVILDTIARAFSDLNLIAAHLGFPWCAEMAMLTITHPNIYFDMAGIDRTEKVYPTIVNIKEQLLWHGNGLSKMLFGTEGGPDALAWVKDEYEDLLRRHGVNENVIGGVMGTTAARLVGMD